LAEPTHTRVKENAMSTYVFDQAWDAERVRLAGLEGGLDPGTIDHLEALGVSAGWRCWEIGGGGGSIAAWLCERVQDAGHVLATDLETSFLGRLPYTNLAVRRHDIVADDVPEGQFDLVHARWVLHWLPARAQALTRMIGALRPDGWLLVEEPDFVTPFHTCSSATVRKVVTAGIRALEAMSGASSEYGRRLFDDVCGQALVDVEALGRVIMMRGKSPLCAHLRLSIEKVQAALVRSGAVTAEEMQEALARLDDPGFTTMSAITMAVWGRRAAEGG
jgi:SAM-dependent methyltransferase